MSRLTIEAFSRRSRTISRRGHTRHHKISGVHDVRGGSAEVWTLSQSLGKRERYCLFEVPNTAVDQLRRTARVPLPKSCCSSKSTSAPRSRVESESDNGRTAAMTTRPTADRSATRSSFLRSFIVMMHELAGGL